MPRRPPSVAPDIALPRIPGMKDIPPPVLLTNGGRRRCAA